MPLPQTIGTGRVLLTQYPPGMVARWTLDDTSSGYRDLIGGRTLTPAGTAPTTAAGIIGNAASFAANGRLTTPDDARLRLAYGLAVELWVYRNDGGFYYPISKDAFSAGARDWGMSVDGTNAEFYTFNSANTQYFARHTSGASQAGQWNHIVGVLHSTGAVRIYVNGVLGGIAGTFSGSLPSTTQQVVVGATGVSTAQLNGRVDELAIWQRGSDPGASFWATRYNAGLGRRP